MSRDRGNRAAGWLAADLRPYWPLAEKTPNGRPGADIENTPGVAWEAKTGKTWRQSWLDQAGRYDGKLNIVVWYLPGIGQKHSLHAPAIMPAMMLLDLLDAADFPVTALPETRSVDWRAEWKTMKDAFIYQPPAPAGYQGIMPVRNLLPVLKKAGYC